MPLWWKNKLKDGAAEKASFNQWQLEGSYKIIKKLRAIRKTGRKFRGINLIAVGGFDFPPFSRAQPDIASTF